MTEPFIIYLDINRICDDDYSECFYSLRDPKTLPDTIDYMGLKDRPLTETVLKVFYDELKEENKNLLHKKVKSIVEALDADLLNEVTKLKEQNKKLRELIDKIGEALEFYFKGDAWDIGYRAKQALELKDKTLAEIEGEK